MNTLHFAGVNLAHEILRFNYPELLLLIKHDLIVRVQLVPVLNQRRREAPSLVSPSEPHPGASLLPCSGIITGSLVEKRQTRCLQLQGASGKSWLPRRLFIWGSFSSEPIFPHIFLYSTRSRETRLQLRQNWLETHHWIVPVALDKSRPGMGDATGHQLGQRLSKLLVWWYRIFCYVLTGFANRLSTG